MNVDLETGHAQILTSVSSFSNMRSLKQNLQTSWLKLLRKIRGFIDSTNAELIYRATIMPTFGHC